MPIMVVADLFVRLMPVVIKSTEGGVGFEAATDLIIRAVVYFLLALLRSWVQIPHNPVLSI
jgi:hypothetical protein